MNARRAPMRHNGTIQTTLKLLSTSLFCAVVVSCSKSGDKIESSLRIYCDTANEMVQNGAVDIATGFVDTAAIYSRWEERNPSKEAQGVIDSFYDRVTDRNWNENSEFLKLEDYQQMMTAAAADFDLAPPICGIFLEALMESKKRGVRIYFVDQVCGAYYRLMADQDKTQFGPQQHDDVLRAALRKATAEARHVNEKSKAFVEDVLAIEPHLRGEAFPRELAKWRGHETEYGDPCRDLVLDVERLYEEHLEKQGIETP